ncbi:MAG: MaoC/PaaZ C-terminal domain-containing protein [Acetobacteraceae bacterium]
MPIDYETLRHFPIPEIRQHWAARDTILYALSIGLGQNPLDPRQLDFVDQHRVLKAVPSMVVVLGSPGFWLADPKTTADAVQLVHGEQGFVIHRPLPAAGDIIGRTRIAGLIDKGAGRAALLYTEKEVIDGATGALIATTTSTTFLRGQGGFGGPAGPLKEVHRIPVGPPEITCDLPTRPEQALYYRLNGDDNPLHADPAVAARAGFPRPILHGLCTLGVVCHALLAALADYDTARLTALDLRFSAPVFPGETLRAEIWRNGAFQARALERDTLVITNGRVVITP